MDRCCWNHSWLWRSENKNFNSIFHCLKQRFRDFFLTRGGRVTRLKLIHCLNKFLKKLYRNEIFAAIINWRPQDSISCKSHEVSFKILNLINFFPPFSPPPPPSLIRFPITMSSSSLPSSFVTVVCGRRKWKNFLGSLSRKIYFRIRIFLGSRIKLFDYFPFLEVQ